MKVSIADDRSIVIQCEIFEASSEPFLVPRLTAIAGSCDDNQIAFRELIAKTKIAVEQIEGFLELSKNKITQFSN